MSLSVVDLPDPDGPTMATFWPGEILSDTPLSNSWTTQAGWEEEDKSRGQRDITTGASGDAVQGSTTHLLGIALAVVEGDVPELEGGRAGPRRRHLDVRRIWVVVYARCDVLQHVAHVAHVDEGLQQLLVGVADEVEWDGQLQQHAVHRHQVAHRHGARGDAVQ